VTLPPKNWQMWLREKLETPGGRYAVAAVLDKLARETKDVVLSDALAESARWLRVRARPRLPRR
jgi:hypothetical protein